MCTNKPYLCAISIVLALLIASCGSGGSSTSTDPNNALVPQNPPSAALPIYSGNKSPATITENNALDFGLAAQRGLDLAARMPLQLIQNVFPGIMYSKTSDVLTQGRINPDGTGWVLSTYTQHNEPSIFVSPDLTNDLNPAHQDLVISGEVLVQYLSSDTATNQNYTISFYNLNVKGAQINITLNGTLNFSLIPEETGSPPAANVTLNDNMSMKDNTSDENWLFSNYSISSNVIDVPTSDVVASGQIFSDSNGYAQVSTPGVHLQYFYTLGELGPFTGGYLKLQGGSGAAYFGGVNYYFASVAVDSNDAGYPTEAQRYSWANNAPDVTPVSWTNGPVAHASILKDTSIGSSGVLDGRFSYSPNGGFITFSWSILLGQPGGNAQLTDSGSPTPTFSADQAGQYLVKLQVSDGTNIASDIEVVNVYSTPGVTGALAADAILQSPTGPFFIKAQIGQTIQLDGRIHTINTADLSGTRAYNWTLATPAGSQATLINPNSGSPSFTPDVNGYYIVMLGQNVRSIIDVGEGFQFSPPIEFIRSSHLLTADLFGTGRNDVVASINTGVAGTYPNGTYVAIYTNAGNGSFQSGMILPGAGGIAIGDLNNDGRPDIASALNYNYADVFLQQSDGQFSLTQSLCAMPSGCTEQSGEGQVWIQKIGTNTLPSIMVNAVSNSLDIFSPNGAGGYLPAVTVLGPADFDTAWNIGDVNGDGISDLVGILEGNTSAQLFVMPGHADGSFGAATVYPDQLSDGCEPPEGVSTNITDINSDGRNDVVVSGDDQLLIYLQQPGGTLGQPESLSLTSVTCSMDIPAIGDINNDGLPDIVSVDGDNLRIILQDSQHNFSSVTEYPVYQDINYFDPSDGQVVISDINGDGIPDLILPGGIVMLGISYPGTPP